MPSINAKCQEAQNYAKKHNYAKYGNLGLSLRISAHSVILQSSASQQVPNASTLSVKRNSSLL